MISVIDYSLIVMIIVECATAALLLLRRDLDVPGNISLEQAFETLNLSIQQSYPNLPEGYTWKEVLVRIETEYRKQKKIEWDDVRDTLKKYEAFRYGGIRFEKDDSRPILRLARMLRRRQWIAR